MIVSGIGKLFKLKATSSVSLEKDCRLEFSELITFRPQALAAIDTAVTFS
jgi:hypothetical protein